MKILVAFAILGLVTLCTGEKIPSIPGDNSDYIEGISRYIWIPDGEGKSYLVDLLKPYTEADVENAIKNVDKIEYWLFTRESPTIRDLLIYGDSEMLAESNYRASRPTIVIVHGWLSNATSPINTLITSAFLDVQDCNVIVVDWSSVAMNLLYPVVVEAVPSVGLRLGNFLIWLFGDIEGDWPKVHLVGFSLGAHVVGNAGRTINSRADRVTGLDPAGPKWGDNQWALSFQAGQYVEVIHTNGGRLGLFNKLGDADFYPNGGKEQPGCILDFCSHSRAYKLFAASVRKEHLNGHECNSMYEAEYKKCSGAELSMGNGLFGKNGSGIFGLTTGSEWPF